MLLWKFLHVASMTAAIAIPVVAAVLPTMVSRTGDVRAIRSVFGAWNRFANAILPLLGLGAVAGFATALVIGYDLLSPWLVISYVLVSLALVVAMAWEAPWHVRVLKLALASPDDRPSDELAGYLHRTRRRWPLVAMGVLAVLMVFDMVVKPFS